MFKILQEQMMVDQVVLKPFVVCCV